MGQCLSAGVSWGSKEVVWTACFVNYFWRNWITISIKIIEKIHYQGGLVLKVKINIHLGYYKKPKQGWKKSVFVKNKTTQKLVLYGLPYIFWSCRKASSCSCCVLAQRTVDMEASGEPARPQGKNGFDIQNQNRPVVGDVTWIINFWFEEVHHDLVYQLIVHFTIENLFFRGLLFAARKSSCREYQWRDKIISILCWKLQEPFYPLVF